MQNNTLRTICLDCRVPFEDLSGHQLCDGCLVEYVNGAGELEYDELPKVRNHTIYTLGYQRWTPAALQATCADLGAALLDIRYSPRSQRPEWAGEALAQMLGATYTHCGALGNRNYKGGGIELAAPTKALPFVRNMLASQPVILLCVCADYRSCHRTVAATWLAQRLGNPVVHLEPPAKHAEPGPLTFTGEPLAYWRDEAARGCTASLGRLRGLCATRGASYDATLRGLL